MRTKPSGQLGTEPGPRQSAVLSTSPVRGSKGLAEAYRLHEAHRPVTAFHTRVRPRRAWRTGGQCRAGKAQSVSYIPKVLVTILGRPALVTKGGSTQAPRLGMCPTFLWFLP